ncbi:DUF982 domain-containing protein [Sinorhizobium medicae]|uniref:DUF982 domain-containing protein n=2 Tax=Sinorhizobium medicae TaxID=110321 RepID=A0A508WZ51_9HYPH|nr:DUF982 domain-containing protein [Sinorhizobium medicae]ABR60526.1 protein of unknown function DUF982 [Sinorhizobium medicae WSM419]MBO1944146.1 DUF982 domain-containing protein [Sinorhizobium medicae]MBO1965154.1 DUF982 domain-containing protein [Sinorhizobium medicae]MDX0406627.1 DUF982 domain-containing protein [Sinorhizobium medicae]MDX0413179.1 DUF982 domain-containing protein [Sinorhizobium medicae]
MQVLWRDPIELGLNGGDVRMVKGPSDALACLADHWPYRGPYYVAARSACRAAIDGRRTCEEARKLFLSAAEEARLKAH